MQELAELFTKIDQTKSTKEKIQFIKTYFDQALPADAIWTLYFLSGKRLKRLIGSSKLFNWCIESLEYPVWLCEESYEAVGDIAETIALLVAPKKISTSPIVQSLSSWIENKILPLQSMENGQQKEQIFTFWQQLSSQEIFILNKILTGSLRVGVSHLITLQALSLSINVNRETLSHLLMGNWEPTEEFYIRLKQAGQKKQESSLNPYPFYLASPWIGPLENLGSEDEWTVEWKWDGIRAQGINRKEGVALWSRGNELISSQFPEIVEAVKYFAHDTVLDGEILAYRNDKPLPFGELQKRLGRKKVSKAMIESVPIVFMIYDILEIQGKDTRKLPFKERRALLETLSSTHPLIKISPFVSFSAWSDLPTKRDEARKNGTEGLMIKKRNSSYGVGRRRGNWWKYKVDPHTIDAILVYAQPGQGWRANLLTDYTFAVWHNGELVPIAKAYSGLSQDEILELDKWLRKHTIEKFGPVRKVAPGQVFEIAFEGIQKSSRHKSGVALRFPRIQRWRKDKPPEECDNLDSIKLEFFKEL